jgi:hypothetical protein
MKSISNQWICQFCNKAKGKHTDHSICSKKLQENSQKTHRNTKSKYAYSEKRINQFIKFVD